LRDARDERARQRRSQCACGPARGRVQLPRELGSLQLRSRAHTAERAAAQAWGMVRACELALNARVESTVAGAGQRAWTGALRWGGCGGTAWRPHRARRAPARRGPRADCSPRTRLTVAPRGARAPWRASPIPCCRRPRSVPLRSDLALCTERAGWIKIPPLRPPPDHRQVDLADRRDWISLKAPLKPQSSGCFVPAR
jgi:hypothetical protein